MNYLDNISFLILLDEVGEARQLLENLVSLNHEVSSEVSIGLLPFISSIGDGIINFLPEDSFEEFPRIGQQEFKQIIANVRVSSKQYTDKKFNKALKMILGIEESFYLQMMKEYDFLQKLIIKLFGQPEFGVYYFKGIPYANTNQYHIYLENILSKIDRRDLPYFSEEATSLFCEYSKNLGTLINSSNLKKILEQSTNNISTDDFELRDFYLLDQKRRNFLTGNLPLELQLFLFNILCQNNFILYVMPVILESKRYFFTRSLVQSYLVSITALRFTDKKYSNNFSDSQRQQFREFIDNKEKLFNVTQEFRNNIFHYKIEGVPIENFINQNHFFEDLIVFHSGKTFRDFQELLISEVVQINKLISSVITKPK